jgi:hypothetical protein
MRFHPLKHIPMVATGYIPEIEAVKTKLREFKKDDRISEWELPYEETLTRLTAAIFFLTPAAGTDIGELWAALEIHDGLQHRPNEEKKLSGLPWRVEFNKGFEI